MKIVFKAVTAMMLSLAMVVATGCKPEDINNGDNNGGNNGYNNGGDNGGGDNGGGNNGGDNGGGNNGGDNGGGQAEEEITLPTVITFEAAQIMQQSAVLGGEVTDDGNDTVTERGVCWGTATEPTVNGNHLTNGQGTGAFTVDVRNLTASTTYYVRAYAVNSAGTAYGNEVSFTTLDIIIPDAPEGAIDGIFSVSATKKVFFSQGNLQYNRSTDTWRFAEYQELYYGQSNGNGFGVDNGWIDLFGWGTSGCDHGANCYEPWSTSTEVKDYYAYGGDTLNLYDQTGLADWGAYNPISNGGNVSGMWRTLTDEEWHYVFKVRSTQSGIRYAKAQWGDINGILLLPDNWSSSIYGLYNTNTTWAAYTSNVIDDSVWEILENAGVVFLPTAGHRVGDVVSQAGVYGYYWSSTAYGELYSHGLNFSMGDVEPSNGFERSHGLAVRLVYDAY